ncbi:MAG: preprotein translocase subunit SecE [Dehalococcoidales bacterium]|jgi:preprotein translocase subunit SecE|nr:preprotein translocase subunit SecE [Dehalococcoidales bacterium]MDD3994345.1 preprotein translocase subunit SecE [Dehalococcoidales bacterium]NLT28167.1 preprotein translocase subunit SecE [Dehalococcoidales bacterium]
MAQTTQPAEKKGRGFKLFGNVIAELKKVTWLSRKEAIYLTGLVLLVAVIVGLILGGIDWIFSFLIEKIFTGS